MSTYSLICTDIDGTLFRDDLSISARNRQALQDAIQAGYHVALVSGRSASNLQAIARQLGITTSVGSFNGALTLSEEAVILDQRPIDYQDAVLALDDLAHTELEFFLYTNLGWYSQGETRWHEIEESITGIKGSVAPLRELEEHLTGEEIPLKLLAMHHDDSYISRMTATLEEHFAGRLNIFNSHPNYIEILPPSAHKGRSVEALTKHYGITREQVMVIGDYFNDVPMFEAAGLAIAMGNAPAGVQEKAHRITASNGEDGLALALESVL